MKRDESAHFRIPSDLKEEAKKYAVIDNRSLSGFFVESVKDRVNKLKLEQKKAR